MFLFDLALFYFFIFFSSRNLYSYTPHPTQKENKLKFVLVRQFSEFILAKFMQLFRFIRSIYNTVILSFLYRYRYRSVTFLFVTIPWPFLANFLIVPGPFPHPSGLKKSNTDKRYRYRCIKFWVIWIFDRYILK